MSGPEITSIQLYQHYSSTALTQIQPFSVDLISGYLFTLLPVPNYLYHPSASGLKDEWLNYYGTGDILKCNDNPVVPIRTYLCGSRQPSLRCNNASLQSMALPYQWLQGQETYRSIPFTWVQGFNFGINSAVLIARGFLVHQVGNHHKPFGFHFDCFTRLNYWAELFPGNWAEVSGLRSQE